MSEADNVWRIDVDGVVHDVEVEHSTFTGKIVVKLDGQVMGEDRLWFSKEQIEFTIGSTPVRVAVDNAYGGFATRSSLHVDGRFVEPLRR